MTKRAKTCAFIKAFCTVLSFTLLFGTVAPLSLAKAEEVAKPTITIGSIEAEDGDDISLPVTIENAKDILGMQFVIEYDVDVFNHDGNRTFMFGDLGSDDWFVAKDFDTKQGRVKIAMASEVGFENNDAVRIGTLNLAVRRRTPSGDYRLTIDKFDAFNVLEEEVDFTKVYGTVTVEERRGQGPSFPGRGGRGEISRGGGTITTTPPTPPTPSTPPVVAGFKDVPRDHWAASHIEEMKEKGIIDGRSADSFEPQGNVTRAEFSKLITAALGLELSQEGAQFSDIAEGEWYTSYIAAAVEAGIVMGRPDGSFGPNDSISRQDMAVMVVRALKLEIPENIDEYLTFEDKDQISDYAKAALAAAVKAGLIRGRSETQLDPMGVTTRAEAATIIHRLMQHLEQLAQAEQSEQAEQVEAAEESEETEEPEQSEETEETEEVEEVDESDETEELEESDETEESEE